MQIVERKKVSILQNIQKLFFSLDSPSLLKKATKTQNRLIHTQEMKMFEDDLLIYPQNHAMQSNLNTQPVPPVGIRVAWESRSFVSKLTSRSPVPSLDMLRGSSATLAPLSMMMAVSLFTQPSHPPHSLQSGPNSFALFVFPFSFSFALSTFALLSFTFLALSFVLHSIQLYPLSWAIRP